MNFYDWEERYETELYDAWCESDYEKIADFIDAKWEEYKESLEEAEFAEWENRQ